MILPVALALALAKPGLARTWASAVGLSDSTLALTPDGAFIATFRPKGKPVVVVRGTYAVGPIPSASRRGNLKNAQTILFIYDLASLKRLGTPQAQIDDLKRQGKPGQLGMKLYYVPDFPLLSDLARFHFVDAKERTAASRRLRKWKPF